MSAPLLPAVLSSRHEKEGGRININIIELLVYLYILVPSAPWYRFRSEFAQIWQFVTNKYLLHEWL